MNYPVRFEYTNGKIIWQNKKGQLHREDGPAVIHPNNKSIMIEEWYFEGKRHRKDGPAIFFIDDSFSWFYHGEYYKFEDFCSLHEVNNEFELITFLKLMYG